MLQIPLAALALCLLCANANNPPVCFYWLLVCAYWVLNYLNQNGRKNQ